MDCWFASYSRTESAGTAKRVLTSTDYMFEAEVNESAPWVPLKNYILGQKIARAVTYFQRSIKCIPLHENAMSCTHTNKTCRYIYLGWNQTSVVGITAGKVLIATVMFFDFHMPLQTAANPPAPTRSLISRSLYWIVAIVNLYHVAQLMLRINHLKLLGRVWASPTLASWPVDLVYI